MTTFCTLNNKIRIVNEQKLMDLTNRWLPKDLDTDIKTAFRNSDFVRIYKRIVGEVQDSDTIKSWMEHNDM